jgi:hypothetical protein
LNEATTKLGSCQVRSKTEQPCPRRAEVEILGVAFCGPCAREQEAYFAIGELVDEEARDFRKESLAEALEGMRRVRAGSSAGITALMHHGLSGVRETESLALPNS